MTKDGIFYYQEDVPKECIPRLREVIEKTKWILPPWILRVWVEYTPQSDGNTIAQSIVSYEYRYIKIFLRPAFLSEEPEDQINTLVHEFLHASVNVLADYVAETMKKLLEDQPKFAETVSEEIERRTEAAVCDLAHVIAQRMT